MSVRIDVAMDLGAQRYTRPPSKVPASKREAIRAAEAEELARVREEHKRLKAEFLARQENR